MTSRDGTASLPATPRKDLQMTAYAMLSHAPGGPETLEWTQIAPLRPGPGEVCIRVAAAAVNFPDTLIIRDLYQYRPSRPFAPGSEVAGTVEAVGEGVADLAEGDRVLALVAHGGFATHALAKAAKVARIPDGMPFDAAAALIFTYGTCHHALVDRGALAPGETLLVLGAAGGIGAAAVELGLALGARVVAAVSSEEKAAFCRELGAQEVLVYPERIDRDGQKAFGAAIKAAAGTVDVVCDPVGGGYAEPALRALGWGGRHLVIGFAAGIPEIPLNLPLLKSCQIVGVFWGAFTERDPDGFRAQQDALLKMWEEGRINPRISARLPLARAAEALALVETRQAMGKIVLTAG